jgi:subtilisin
MEDIYDGPEFGGPIVSLPPDDVIGPLFVHEASTVPDAWHRFDWIKEKLWQVATGKDIRVAVLDTGYTKHAFGPEPIAKKSFISGESTEDLRSGHGSHCIGSVMCRRDTAGNSLGLAPDADLIVGKVLSNGGSGGSDGIAAGIRWAADQGAHIISMSLGGGGSYKPTNDAIDYAWSKGCIVTAAAGNAGYNGSNTIGWPAKYENCLCTGSYAEGGKISNFSSGGREIDWACPGSNVISFSNSGSGWRTLSGTSMATPQGAGFLACLMELWLRQGRPAFRSAEDLRNYFKQVLKDAGAEGFDVRFGWGVPGDNFLAEAILKDLDMGA